MMSVLFVLHHFEQQLLICCFGNLTHNIDIDCLANLSVYTHLPTWDKQHKNLIYLAAKKQTNMKIDHAIPDVCINVFNHGATVLFSELLSDQQTWSILYIFVLNICVAPPTQLWWITKFPVTHPMAGFGHCGILDKIVG